VRPLGRRNPGHAGVLDTERLAEKRDLLLELIDLGSEADALAVAGGFPRGAPAFLSQVHDPRSGGDRAGSIGQRTLSAHNRTDTFFRLFGDADGDGHVDVSDLRSFLSTLGKRAGDPGCLWYFDYDGDGRVDLGDLLQLLRRLG
jgi:hypothetical protein